MFFQALINTTARHGCFHRFTFARYLQTNMTSVSRQLPQCWGHRGVSALVTAHIHYLYSNITPQASATFPENTLASFEAAMRDGAEGIESGNYMRSSFRC